MIVVGLQIQAGRALLGWSAARLATEAGLHRNEVFYHERASVTDGFAVAVC